jgi:hypothetical protein
MANIEFPGIFAEGGDDRLALNSKGVNKYFCRPEVTVCTLLLVVAMRCTTMSANACRCTLTLAGALLSLNPRPCARRCALRKRHRGACSCMRLRALTPVYMSVTNKRSA